MTLIVISGSPGTGKSTIAAALAADLRWPLLPLDPMKETLADVLGLGDEEWSNQLGDAAAEIIFRLSAEFPDVMNPAILDRAAMLAATVTPLRLGAAVVEADTGQDGAPARAVASVREALGR